VNTKSLLIGIVAVAAIVAAALSIYRNNRAPKDEVKLSVQEAVGEALAEETIKATGARGQIVIVTLEEGQLPELDQYVAAFKDRIYDTAVKIARTDHISADKINKYGPGSGMSGKRFARIIQKYQNADAIVSFVGTPDGEDEELKEIKPPVPKFIAFSRAPDDIDDMFEDKLLFAAVVPRFEFPAPGPEKVKTKQELFQKHYQVVRVDTNKPK
jgi:hypothetical protein